EDAAMSLHESQQSLAMQLARRQFLKTSGMGLGATVLGSLLAARGAGGGEGRPSGPHFTPRARRVIFLFMAGAPSQLDLFDHKPQLYDRFQEPLPPSVSNGQRVTAMTRGREQRIAPSKFSFHRHPVNGDWWSEL